MTHFPQPAGLLPRKPRQPGFTLIELLVVISIISLLAAILFPVFGRVRENARRASCASNMKQIGLGVLQYLQDFDECMPQRRFISGGFEYSWRTLIQPYTKSVQVFRCPSRNNPGIANDKSGFSVSYAANVAGSDVGVGRGAFSPYDDWLLKISAFQSPSTTIAIVENYGHNTAGLEIDNASSGDPNSTSATQPVCSAAPCPKGLWAGHFSMSNYIFMDGHVKALKPFDTVANNTNQWYRTNLMPTGTLLTNTNLNLQRATDNFQ